MTLSHLKSLFLETKTRQSRRERIKRNSSTRMGPLAPLAISRKVKETII